MTTRTLAAQREDLLRNAFDVAGRALAADDIVVARAWLVVLSKIHDRLREVESYLIALDVRCRQAGLTACDALDNV